MQLKWQMELLLERDSECRKNGAPVCGHWWGGLRAYSRRGRSCPSYVIVLAVDERKSIGTIHFESSA